MDTGRKAGMMNRQLDEKIFIEVNGIRQGMFLQSENTENPVLLYLHGGPGSPEIAFTQDYPTGLEQLFTVCWWEQRGSGISYSRKVTKETMTIGQMIEDATAVTNYLRRRFGKEKIYVLGHSWGSVLGVLTVQKSPELFHGYIGIGQVVCQSKSECLAYSFMVNEFTAAGDRKMLRRLEKFPIDRGGEVSFQYLAVRSVGMMKLGIGIMHHLDSMSDCIKIVLRYKGYTLKDKLHFVMGSGLALKCLWDFVMQTDFVKQVPHLEIPIYIFQGWFDYQVSYSLAKEFADTVKAPVKGFYTFENSAHSPCFEEPKKMCRIIREDVLQGKCGLADG